MQTKIQFKKLKEIFLELKELPNQSLLLVIDKKFYGLYRKQLKSLIGSLKNEKKVLVFPSTFGEKGKSFKDVENICEYFLERGITRDSHLIAIGGGAVGDLSGFCASILLRGIPWSLIPTTLLSMVDSSVGGKTGINSNFGKNLIGSFHLPENIWIDTSLIQTLPNKQLDSGKGEIIKYCFLDSGIYKEVMNDVDLLKVIESCLNFKTKITLEDPKEKGIRKYLNLGHTLGHAIEKHYGISHGRSVMWGIFLMLLIGGRKDLLADFFEISTKLLGKVGQPPWLKKGIPVESLVDFIKRDKKAIGSSEIEIVLLSEIGKPLIKKIKIEELTLGLERIKNEFNN
jgi:3-dehydroquinate synthetase